MALIDKASLLMVPSTYEAGKLYNVLPSGNRAPDSTDQNSGYDQTRADFDFDRGSNASATRIGSDGLIKKYRENLLLQSNQFDTTWILNAATITGGQSGYDGTNNAWKLQDTAVTGEHFVRQTPSVGNIVSFSVYAKANTLNFLWLRSVEGGVNKRTWFDLSSGSVGTSQGIDATIEPVGTDGWYRCSATFNHQAAFEYYIAISDANGSSSYTGDGTGSIFIQNAQLEKGLVATDYLDSTSVTGKAGVLVDLPRINYDANGENGALLLEPSRANLIPQSEYLAIGWTYDNTSVISNSIVSPTGEISASKLLDNTTNGLHRMYYITGTSASAHRFSIFLKKAEYSKVEMESLSGVTTNITYDLLNGTATSVGEIEPYGNDWYRCIFPMSTTSPSNAIQIRLVNNSNSSFFVGTGTSGVHMFGAMLEAGSYATSYIPTMGTSETRAADLCTGGGSAESINSVEGVLYAEIAGLSNDTARLSISDGTNNNNIYIELDSSNVNAVGRVGGSNQFALSSLQTITNNNKVAVKYKANDFALYVNGTEVATDTSGSTYSANTLTSIQFNRGDGGVLFYGNVKQVAVFNEALSNSELATLTTL